MPAARSRIGIANLIMAGLAVSVATSLAPAAVSAPRLPGAAAITPIQHLVVLYLENHSFDNVLGRLCVADARCDGTLSGKTSNGQTIPLQAADDYVPKVAHGRSTQIMAVNGGAMNGWDQIGGCTQAEGYRCYQAFQPSQIPNLAALARHFVISDRTFESELVPTFGSHVFILAAQLGGFQGTNPVEIPGNPNGPGWGCDSYLDAKWRATPSGRYALVPSCFPNQLGAGPYRSSPVPWVPTIMDRLDVAGLSWKLYTPASDEPGYIWAGCPYFAECIYGPQGTKAVPVQEVVSDAQAGTLPSVSFVFPHWNKSQHNQSSMVEGDTFIGSVVGAVMNGPQWSSTAVLITYDDCGCFYDHVPPPNGLGIRQPMVIVSPYARPGFTDSTVASFASILALIERNWGLPPLTAADGGAYDYRRSFNFAQAPLKPIPMVYSPVSPMVHRMMEADPPDPNDPN
ncbi:MAG TPA: alkaline phosphatase family protein [Actinomycetota bacterium]|nr:alkaline phosphatase family protein [Actinomycetota bacterium]